MHESFWDRRITRPKAGAQFINWQHPPIRQFIERHKGVGMGLDTGPHLHRDLNIEASARTCSGIARFVLPCCICRRQRGRCGSLCPEPHQAHHTFGERKSRAQTRHTYLNGQPVAKQSISLAAASRAAVENVFNRAGDQRGFAGRAALRRLRLFLCCRSFFTRCGFEGTRTIANVALASTATVSFGFAERVGHQNLIAQDCL